MKIKKTTTILVVITTLLATFGGCSKINDNETYNPEQSTSYVESVQHSDQKDEPLPEACIAPLTIWRTEGKDLVEELINEINFSRAMTEEQRRENGNYTLNGISEIEEFHRPIKIDGFELFLILVGERGFAYYYAPVGQQRTQGRHDVSYDSDIRISIGKRAQDISGVDWLKEVARVNEGAILTEDNFVFFQNQEAIAGYVGEDSFTIMVPDKLSNYEYLRDLAWQVIKTAELVNVEQELAVRNARAAE